MNKYLQIFLGSVLCYLTLFFVVFLGSENLRTAFIAPLCFMALIATFYIGIFLISNGVSNE